MAPTDLDLMVAVRTAPVGLIIRTDACPVHSRPTPPMDPVPWSLAITSSERPGSIPEPVAERVDDIPLILWWLQRMRIDAIIDQFLPEPHGNRQGLSYGQLAVVFLTYILTQCDHRMCSVEDWARHRLRTLRQATGWEIGEKDCTDDRLEDLLSALGNEEGRPWEPIEQELGQYLIRAYRLPTDVARCDTSSFSVYHQVGEQREQQSLFRFGHSKDHRPDLRQYLLMLSTLDPAGIPLVTVTLPGNTADDTVYVPAWRRMKEVIGRPDFLFVADCKAASYRTRATLAKEGGFYLFPLPMTGHVPQILRSWVLNPPVPIQPIYLPGQPEGEAAAAQGFEMTLGVFWTEGSPEQTIRWHERWLALQSAAWREHQLRGLYRQLEQAEQALSRLGERPGPDPGKLEQQAQAVLKQYKVEGLLKVEVTERVWVEERYVGPGRPGPNRPTHLIEHRKLELSVERQPAAIEEAEALAGWRLYVTDAPAEKLSLAQAAAYYREQWQPERGFHRLKRGLLSALPVYLQDEERISGLMFLLTLALRFFTLMEFVVRRQLAETGEKLSGLYDGNPRRATARPTAELLLAAFRGITLHGSPDGQKLVYHMDALSPLQRRILELMGVPESIYTDLAPARGG